MLTLSSLWCRSVPVVVAGAVLLCAAPAAHAADALDPGTYRANVTLTGEGLPGTYTLQRVEVSARSVRFFLTFHAPDATVTLSCPDEASFARGRARILVPTSTREQIATKTWCSEHLGKRVRVASGKTVDVDGTFPQGAWSGSSFALNWYGYSATGIRLRDGVLVADPRLQDGWLRAPSGWLGYALLVVAFLAGVAWIRLLLNRWRVLASAAGAGMAWQLGVHSWWGLLFAATAASFVAFAVQSLRGADLPRLLPTGASGASSSVAPATSSLDEYQAQKRQQQMDEERRAREAERSAAQADLNRQRPPEPKPYDGPFQTKGFGE